MGKAPAAAAVEIDGIGEGVRDTGGDGWGGSFGGVDVFGGGGRVDRGRLTTRGYRYEHTSESRLTLKSSNILCSSFKLTAA